MSDLPAPIVTPRQTAAPAPTEPERRPSQHRRWWFLLLLASAIAGGVLYRQRQERLPSDLLPPAAAGLHTATVQTGTVQRTLRLTGVTVAENQFALITPTLRGRRGAGGRYTLTLQKLVPPGSRVRSGDVVAAFDNQYMLNRLDDYRSRVVQHRAQIRKSGANLDIKRTAHQQKIRAAKGTVDKAKLDLETIPIRSAIQAERFRLAHEEAEASYQQLLQEVRYIEISEGAEIRRQELDLQEAEVEFRRAQANVDRMLVRAPVDGLTVMLTLRRGTELDRVKEGDRLESGMPYMLIVDLSSMAVIAELSQVDSEELRIGARAIVSFDAFPDLVLPARVYSIGTIARATARRGSQFVNSVPVKLRLEENDPRAIPNYSVSADIILAEEKNVVTVPRECVFSDDAAQQPYAFVQGQNGWEKRELKLGLANNVTAAVRSGLEEGEVVSAERPPLVADIEHAW